jgi:hypothetical protein
MLMPASIRWKEIRSAAAQCLIREMGVVSEGTSFSRAWGIREGFEGSHKLSPVQVEGILQQFSSTTVEWTAGSSAAVMANSFV